MEIVVLWYLLSVLVGFRASAHGRHGFGWAMLACVISPLLAGCLLWYVGPAGVTRSIPPVDAARLTASGADRWCPQCRALVRAQVLAQYCPRCEARVLRPDEDRG